MNAAFAHWLSAVVIVVLGIIWLIWFAWWWLDQVYPARIHLRTWRLRDGRQLVQWVDDETEHYAVGSAELWEEAVVTGPPPLARGEPIVDPITMQYLMRLWARSEQERRARDDRRARRERQWAKQNKASLAQLEQLQEESQEEPRVVSAFWGGSSTP